MSRAVLLSAVLLLSTIPPLDWHALIWLAWIPLIRGSEGAASRKAAALGGAAFGLLYYAFFFRWLLRLSLPALIGASLAGALYGAYFAVGVRGARGLPRWARAALIPLVWTAPLFIVDNPIRPFCGSLLLVGGLHSPLPPALFQLARPLGEVGVMFFVLLLNALLSQVIELRARPRLAARFAVSAAVILVGAWAWGERQVRAFTQAPRRPSFRAACAQHDMPFPWAWRAGHQDEIHKTYEAMALEAAAKGADLVLFPQYHIPGDILRRPEPWGEIARKAGVYMSLGTYTPVNPMAFGKEAWVTALVFAPDGRLVGAQKALHPSPMGRPMVLAGDAAEAIEIPPFGKLAVLSCYDDVTPRAARMFSSSQPDLIAANANDGLFKGTIHPRLHQLRSRLRAVESRTWVVRCTPNGISSVIDPLGRVKQALPEGRGLLLAEW